MPLPNFLGGGGPTSLMGGGGGGMGNMLPMLGMQIGQNMASGKKSGGMGNMMQQMMPLLQQRREQEMWEALQKRIQQQGLMSGDAARMAAPGVQAGGAGPPMGGLY